MKIGYFAMAVFCFLSLDNSTAATGEVLHGNTLGGEWVTVSELVSEDYEFYLKPQSLHKNPDSRNYQLGVVKIFKSGGRLFFDFQVAGCKVGGGLSRRGDDGMVWNKPVAWQRNGRRLEDRLATVACEIVLDCEQSFSALKKRRYIDNGGMVNGRYYKNESIESLDGMCGRAA